MGPGFRQDDFATPLLDPSPLFDPHPESLTEKAVSDFGRL